MADRIETPMEGELLIDRPLSHSAPCRQGCRHRHSYTADGRRLCWRGGSSPLAAVDAEQADAPVPEALGRRWPLEPCEFWRQWTRAEVHAKLLDVPVLVWATTHGLGAPDADGVRTTTRAVGDLVVSFGVLTGDRSPGTHEPDRTPR